MKKKMYLLLLTLVLTGCGSGAGSAHSAASEAATSESVSSAVQNGSEVIEVNKPETVKTEVTMDNLASFPETDPSMFYGHETEDGFAIEGCNSNDEVIVVPAQLNGKNVVEICQYGLSSLACKAIKLPDSVSIIDSYGIINNDNLKIIDVGKGLKEIGLFSLSACPLLESVEFPENLELVKEPIFGMNDNLKEVYIPNNTHFETDRIASYDSCPNLIIVTPSGSEAEQIANNQGIPVKNK